jgi:hypothetical protein
LWRSRLVEQYLGRRQATNGSPIEQLCIDIRKAGEPKANADGLLGSEGFVPHIQPRGLLVSHNGHSALLE